MVEDEVVLTVGHACDIDICSTVVDVHDVVDDISCSVIGGGSCIAAGTDNIPAFACSTSYRICLPDINLLFRTFLSCTSVLLCLLVSVSKLVLIECVWSIILREWVV